MVATDVNADDTIKVGLREVNLERRAAGAVALHIEVALGVGAAQVAAVKGAAHAQAAQLQLGVRGACEATGESVSLFGMPELPARHREGSTLAERVLACARGGVTGLRAGEALEAVKVERVVPRGQAGALGIELADLRGDADKCQMSDSGGVLGSLHPGPELPSPPVRP